MKIVICGAGGNMGKEVVRAVTAEGDLDLVGAVDLVEAGKDAGEISGLGSLGTIIKDDLRGTLEETGPEVMVDFTSPFVVMKNMEVAMECGVDLVVGTTGITEGDIAFIQEKAAARGVKAIIAPNFALGAVLMMKFAREAGRYFQDVEIIELHHDQKIDAPSGTAIKTAEMISLGREYKDIPELQVLEKIPGVRGGEKEGIKIHSIRLPGLVAHQEVIFGGLGQTFTLRHDSLNRTSFMPGVIMAIRKIKDIQGVVYGLENII